MSFLLAIKQVLVRHQPPILLAQLLLKLFQNFVVLFKALALCSPLYSLHAQKHPRQRLTFQKLISLTVLIMATLPTAALEPRPTPRFQVIVALILDSKPGLQLQIHFIKATKKVIADWMTAQMLQESRQVLFDLVKHCKLFLLEVFDENR